MTYEVILSVRMVISKYKLSEIIWDLICDIMSAIVDNIEEYGAYCADRCAPCLMNPILQSVWVLIRIACVTYKLISTKILIALRSCFKMIAHKYFAMWIVFMISSSGSLIAARRPLCWP